VTRVDNDRRRGGPAPEIGAGPGVKACAYLALLLVGALEALIGTFQYSAGPGSLVAICFAAGILVTCVLGGWGMRTGAGGVLPAVGWLAVSIVLGTSSAGGSVLVTDSPQGKWFLFGGAVGAAGGAVISFSLGVRHGRLDQDRRRRPGGPSRGGFQ
jgi:hypothetical protein